jgi:hypothetical protein
MGVGLTDAAWRAVGASVVGSGHRARGVGCEDACAVAVADDGALLIVVADGAGSAAEAALGARVAVASALEALRRGADVGDALLVARAAVEDVAGAAGRPVGALAATVLATRVTAESLETAQVGDGALVVRRGGAYEVPAPDDKGEYLNETCFLTSDGWRAAMRRATVPAEGIDGVAAMTDGLQLLAFDLGSGAPHAPFFEPFLAFAAEGGPVEQLEEFLGSARVGERTDDDVTLVVAARDHGRRQERQRPAGT